MTIPTFKKRRLCTWQRWSVGTSPLKNSFFAKLFFFLEMPTVGFPRGGRVQAFREAPEAQTFWISIQFDSHITLIIVESAMIWCSRTFPFLVSVLTKSCINAYKKGGTKISRWRGHGGKCNASTGDSFTCTLKFSKFRCDVDRLVGKHHYEEL